MSLRTKSGAGKALFVAAMAVYSQRVAGDDITYIGVTPGSAGLTANWSTNTVPGPNDTAIFNGTGGSISLGSFHPGALEIRSDNWTFHSGTLKTLQLRNYGGDNNRIASDVHVTGDDYFGPNPYFICSADSKTNIDGIIEDPSATDPLEVHLNARLSGVNTYSGRTQVWSWLELRGAGSILNSPQIDVVGSTFQLSNHVSGGNNNRIGDTAQINLRYGEFVMVSTDAPDGLVTETAYGMTIERGSSRINILPTDDDDTHGAVLHLAGPEVAFSRIEHGTAEVFGGNTEAQLGNNVKLTIAALPQGITSGSSDLERVVPYLSSFSNTPDGYGVYAPVIYDRGDDEEVGTEDDRGLRTIRRFEFTEMPDIATNPAEHALVTGTQSVSGTKIMNTLSMGDDSSGAPQLTVNGTLQVKSGVIVMNNGARIVGGNINSSETDEYIVHVPSGSAEITSSITADVLTKGAGGTLKLSAANTVGEVFVNGGRLIMANANACGNGQINLTEADLQIDFASVFHNTIYVQGGESGPTGGGSIIRSLTFGDNVTRTMSGRIEGNSAIGMFDHNTKLILTNSAGNTNDNSPFFYIANDNTLEVAGTYGAWSTGPNGFGGGSVWLTDTATIMGTGFVDGDVTLSSTSRMTPGAGTPNAIGKLTVHAINAFSSDATIEMQIPSTGTRGVSYDALDVTDGFTQIASKIKLSTNGGQPAVGSTFDIIHHVQPLFGGLPTITSDTALTGGRQYVPIYYADKIVIGVAGFTGDANLDGKVNTIDFNALAGNFGQASDANWTMGDFNFTRDIDSLDFNLYAGNYGKKIAGLAPTLGSVVPEPATGVAGLVAAFLTCARRKPIRKGEKSLSAGSN